MPEKVRTYAPGEEVAIEVGFVHEGETRVESVEVVFAREGSNEEIVLLGDAKEENSEEGTATHYVARLGGRVPLEAVAGEYRCLRGLAQDSLDDDWEFADATGMDLVIRVESAPRRLEVTASDFL